MAHKVKITGGTGQLRTKNTKHPKGKSVGRVNDIRAEERKANRRIRNFKSMSR